MGVFHFVALVKQKPTWGLYCPSRSVCQSVCHALLLLAQYVFLKCLVVSPVKHNDTPVVIFYFPPISSRLEKQDVRCLSQNFAKMMSEIGLPSRNNILKDIKSLQ